VAEEAGTLLGFFTICGVPPEGELESLYVDPSAIGQGAGQALLRAAMALARTEGFVALSIHSYPNAGSFYLRHGANPDGRYPFGVHPRPTPAAPPAPDGWTLQPLPDHELPSGRTELPDPSPRLLSKERA
jgi:predicted N-acetyltransferase YhbS